MVNYYTNRPSTITYMTNNNSNKESMDVSRNIKRRHKQTFHVTSETTSTRNDNGSEEFNGEE